MRSVSVLVYAVHLGLLLGALAAPHGGEVEVAGNDHTDQQQEGSVSPRKFVLPQEDTVKDVPARPPFLDPEEYRTYTQYLTDPDPRLRIVAVDYFLQARKRILESHEEGRAQLDEDELPSPETEQLVKTWRTARFLPSRDQFFPGIGIASIRKAHETASATGTARDDLSFTDLDQVHRDMLQLLDGASRSENNSVRQEFLEYMSRTFHANEAILSKKLDSAAKNMGPLPRWADRSELGLAMRRLFSKNFHEQLLGAHGILLVDGKAFSEGFELPDDLHDLIGISSRTWILANPHFRDIDPGAELLENYLELRDYKDPETGAAEDQSELFDREYLDGIESARHNFDTMKRALDEEPTDDVTEELSEVLGQMTKKAQHILDTHGRGVMPGEV